MHYVYILYSEDFDKFYIGESENVAVRLEQHQKRFFSGASTAYTDDWQVVKQISVANRTEARTIERYIKSMKSKIFVRKLIDDELFYQQFCSTIFQKFNINVQ